MIQTINFIEKNRGLNLLSIIFFVKDIKVKDVELKFEKLIFRTHFYKNITVEKTYFLLSKIMNPNTNLIARQKIRAFSLTIKNILPTELCWLYA